MSQATLDQRQRSPFAPETLVRTETGAKLHIAECPHIIGSEIREATAAERLAMELCTWSRAELDGVGRTYCDSLGDAMRLFGTHSGTERLIGDALRFVSHDQIWLPNSQSYVALGLEGRGVAWFGKTYVVPHTGEFLELPGFRESGGGGAPLDEQVGEICPVHHMTMSLTGVCDLCD